MPNYQQWILQNEQTRLGNSVVVWWRSLGRSSLGQNFLLLLPQTNSAAGEEQQAEHVVWNQVQRRFLP